MNIRSTIQRTLQALFITAGISIFALAPAYAADAPKVTADNYVRAESDFQMKGYIESFNNFGKFHHNRKPYDVNNQITIRGNRDTLYSFGVWDLRSPVTITLPETGGRYQSLMIVSQDHSIWGLYGPKTGTLTEEKVGTRYVLLTIRTFADPNDEEDMKEAYRLQDAVVVQQADIGKFEVPDWKKDEVEKMRETINVVASTVTDSQDDIDPDVRIFVRYHRPDFAVTLENSIGLQKGMVGIVNAYVSRRRAGANNVIIAHELLHTLGATDKYDPATLMGPLTSNTGASTYEVPAGINVDDYNEVWIWCDKFSVPLGVAKLSLL